MVTAPHQYPLAEGPFLSAGRQFLRRAQQLSVALRRSGRLMGTWLRASDRDPERRNRAGCWFGGPHEPIRRSKIRRKSSDQYVYSSRGKADGNESMKNLLGGKGAISRRWLDTPSCGCRCSGFTITTEVCTYSTRTVSPIQPHSRSRWRCAQPGRKADGEEVRRPQESALGLGPLRRTPFMPGMMDTVLNVGLNEITIEGLIAHTKNPRFAWDSYRRLIMSTPTW